MDRNTEKMEFPSLEDRIRSAHAERSVAIGAAIGDVLGALWRVLSSFPFSATASEKAQPRSILSRFGSHR
jgi:hypothetical protein